MKYFLINIAVIATFSILFNFTCLSVRNKVRKKIYRFKAGIEIRNFIIISFLLLSVLTIYSIKDNLIYISETTMILFFLSAALLSVRLKVKNE